MVGMKRNLKQTLEIAKTATDPKTKLQARAIANDCYRFILEMSTNAGSIRRFEVYYSKDRRTDRQLQRQKLDKRIEAMDIQEQEEETTTNDIF